MEESSSKNNWVILAVCHILAALMFFSWYSTQTLNPKEDDKSLMYKEDSSLWKSTDTSIFHALNSSFKDSKSAQSFWAVANNRKFDLVSAFLMVSLFTIFIFQGTPEEKLHRIKAGLYMSFCMAAGLGIFKLIFTFERYSPTKFPLEGALLLSEYDHITFELKDASKKSFPGDHATVLFMIAAFIAYYARKWYKYAAALIAVLFTLPRIVGGGHWFTDIVVGGGVIALFTCSWALCSPMQQKGLKILHKPGILLMKICGKVIPALRPPDQTAKKSEAEPSTDEAAS